MSELPVLLLSGVNLNLLGSREPGIYGSHTLEDLVALAQRTGEKLGISVVHQQTNFEGELVELIHGARGTTAAIVINPGAFTHYSYALRDALGAYEAPVIELHISNPARREEFRHNSVVAPVAAGTIAGFGADGYRLAIEAVAAILRPTVTDPGTTSQESSHA